MSAYAKQVTYVVMCKEDMKKVLPHMRRGSKIVPWRIREENSTKSMKNPFEAIHRTRVVHPRSRWEG